MSMPTVELALQCLQTLDYLRLAAEISRLICKTLPDPNMKKDFVDHVELAVSEACTNAIRHTKDSDAEATVAIRFEVHEDRLVVEVKDQGGGFDLEKVPSPNFERCPEDGYGLFIIRTVMDEVFYTRGDDYNTLTMKKYFRKTA
jgi:serine/threonine-protein kinase RsbW